jgi:prepilin-type processing-associated H-X9-DG protein
MIATKPTPATGCRLVARWGRDRPAFSLVELLVALGIMTVTFGLLLVAVQKARETASRANCTSNLRQIGFAFQMYADANAGQYPKAARLPSRGFGLPSIVDELGSYIENRKVFRCPSDTHYWQTEGISYEYPGEFRGGLSLEELQARGRSSDRIWLMYDFDPFHGSPGSGYARNFLYADGHVSP